MNVVAERPVAKIFSEKVDGLRILSCQVRKGSVSISPLSTGLLFTERPQNHYGRVWHHETTNNSCTCQTARANIKCRHIYYLQSNLLSDADMAKLDMSVEF